MRRAWLHGAILVAAFAPFGGAQAHLVVTGLGGAYDGAAHVLSGFQDIAPIVTLGFLAGRRGPAAARTTMIALPAAMAAGGALALAGLVLNPLVGAGAAAAALIGLGLLLALETAARPRVLAVLAAALGVSRGVTDLEGVSGSAGAVTLFGMTACAWAAVTLAASITLPIKRVPLIIAARIAGSWAAATGLLLAGWLFRYGARAI